ncbi:MAG: hypothetical protein AAF771_13765 [Pseudomonadota bacterium]
MTSTQVAKNKTDRAHRTISRLAALILPPALLLASCTATDPGAPPPPEVAAAIQNYDTALPRRPYGASAPWNIPVAGLPRSPQSDRYANLMWNNAPTRQGNFNLAFNSYTYPVYYVDTATTTARVRTEWRTNLNGRRIPWNPAWEPAPGSDSQIILLDPATGREWNFYKASYSDGVVRARNANLVPGNFWTKTSGFAPSRGVGIPYLAMLVRPEDVRRGRIDHALSMPIRQPDGRRFVAPATKLEHATGRSGIPEGKRFALDITEADIDRWLRQMPAGVTPEMKRFGRIVARALRDYGWFVTDTAGSPTLQFESTVSAGAEWEALGVSNRKIGNKFYPRDILDGLITADNIYAIVPSDEY